MDWIGICKAQSNLHGRRLRQHQPTFTSYSQGSMALDQSDYTSATRQNSRATRNANRPCGSPAISWISAAQRNYGYSEREGDEIKKRERMAWGQIGWSAVIRYLKSGHRALQGSPCACAGGDLEPTRPGQKRRRYVTHPAATSATDRGSGGQNRTNRTELSRGLTHSTHERARLRHNVTTVV